MSEEPGYKKLIAWQKADELIFLVYKVTTEFPKNELFGLTSQLRRAVLSIPTNIVEGYARNGKPEFKRFLIIALGSLAETKYLLSVSLRLKYFSESQYTELIGLSDSIGQLLWKLYRAI